MSNSLYSHYFIKKLLCRLKCGSNEMTAISRDPVKNAVKDTVNLNVTRIYSRCIIIYFCCDPNISLYKVICYFVAE